MVVYSDLLRINSEAVGARPAASNAGFDVISVSGDILIDAYCMSTLQRVVHHVRLFFEHYAEIESVSPYGADASSTSASTATVATSAAAAAPGVNDFAAMNRGVHGAVGDYVSGSEKNMDADGAVTILTLIQGILSNLQQLQS